MKEYCHKKGIKSKSKSAVDKSNESLSPKQSTLKIFDADVKSEVLKENRYSNSFYLSEK